MCMRDPSKNASCGPEAAGADQGDTSSLPKGTVAASIEAAQRAYEEAGIQGLCEDGRRELAEAAARRVAESEPERLT